LPLLRVHALPGIYFGSSLSFALSPQGHYAAELFGPTLAIYEISDRVRGAP